MAYERINNSSHARCDLDSVFAYGSFKKVYSGIYVQGERNGQPCVAKEFKTGSVYEDHFYAQELAIMNRAQEIIHSFNAAGIIPNDRFIRMNKPEVWTVECGGDGTFNGKKYLVEPLIENFQKFNSNSGWVAAPDDPWNDVMQALSHYSFHSSGGHHLLCDLQGGKYSNGFVLTDPVVMSQTRQYGPADLGFLGIRDFFRRHRCGRFCKSAWQTPYAIGPAVFPERQGTSMVESLPTLLGRNPLSLLR